jgi:hypothetical protein
VIITQFVGLMIWAVRLDRQVQDNAKQIAELSQQDTYPGRLLKQRVDYNDERLRYIVNYILFMREEIARIAPPQPGGPHPPPVLPPTPGVTPLDPVPRTPEPPK